MEDRVKASLRSSAELMPEEVIIRDRRYYLKESIGEGFKGVVWRGQDEFGGKVAIKFTTPADYANRSYLEEAYGARALRGTGVFADFIDAGTAEIELLDGQSEEFICFVEELVDGWTLPEYLSITDVTPSFLLGYVRRMCEGLNLLKTHGFRHDDLRPENVMIAKPLEGSLEEDQIRVKVIDMGSLKPLETPSRKDKDDHEWFASHLIDIYNSIRRRKDLRIPDRQFLRAIIPLLERMLEEDRAVALVEPAAIVAQFQNAWHRAFRLQDNEAPTLADPFDFIAAEHIASDNLLVHLFAESCPWFKDAAGPNPILLTGPRGCGKSMVFRRLSVKALLHKGSGELLDSKIAGFYVSCSADLRNRLGWISTEELAHRLRKEIVHYFNLVLLRDVIETFAEISQRSDRESIFGFGDSEEAALHAFIIEKLRVSDADRCRLQGVPKIQHALEVIQVEADACYAAMISGRGVSISTDLVFVSEISRFLHQHISYFKTRKAAFLIDDFSVHRIPEPVQRILSNIIWDRQPYHVFKLSAEKYGTLGLGATSAELTRELREIDCGQVYLSLLPRERRHFAKELLARRLELAGYKGTPEMLLGHSRYPERSLGKALRAKSKNPGRHNDQYYGLETIAELCSGDVSVLLEMYRRIFSKAKISVSSTSMVPPHVQHEALVSVARELLDVIKTYHPYGREMYLLVEAFGTMSRRILCEGYLQKKKDSRIPCETTRIEVDASPSEPLDSLSEDHKGMAMQLLRRAIFIELELGRSRHGFTPSVRWQLRRAYCPAFGSSPSKNTAIKWSAAEFKLFLANPKEMCMMEFQRRWQDDRRRVDGSSASDQVVLPLSRRQRSSR